MNTDYEINYLNSIEAEITKYNGTETHVEIPSVIDNHIIVGIGKNAFSENEELEFVELPANIRRIEKYAFEGCTNLKEINLNEGLEVIDEGAFAFCYSLEPIDPPSTLREYYS